jgi:hypothetical protein
MVNVIARNAVLQGEDDGRAPRGQGQHTVAVRTQSETGLPQRMPLSKATLTSVYWPGLTVTCCGAAYGSLPGSPLVGSSS